ncbi:hypothetical protein P2318_05445 [Myxococcaceae bacterium GXIMD 01537]
MGAPLLSQSMLASLVLATALSAAPAAPAPRAAAASDTVVHAPRLDRLGGLSAFMRRAGEHAALFRPSAWAPDFHPFLPLDPTQPASLTAAGVDPAGAATVSFRHDGRVTCLRLADTKLFQSRAQEALQAGGALKSSTAQGVTTVSAPRSAGGTAGYALKGPDVCAFTGPGTAEALQKEASKLVTRAPAPNARLGKLSGVLFVSQGGQLLGLDGTADALQADGNSTRLPLPAFKAAGLSPYGAMKPEGLLFSRAQVAPSALAPTVDALRAQVQRLCTDCPRDEVAAMARAVAERLTGHVLLHVDGVKVRESLRTPEGRFFAPRQALAAEVTDAAAVKTALAPLGKLPGVRALDDGWVLPVKGGTLSLRLQGRQLVLGNDEAVVQNLLAALPEKGAKLSRAAEFTVDPKRVARGLSQVSLLDIMADEQLAGLFALSAELGPLLAASERITGWLDSAPGGGHRFALTWTLPPAP